MSSYSERDAYSEAGDWLLGTVRRNPEALLLMAAGCCLMMRRGSPSRMSSRPSYERDEWQYQPSRTSSEVQRASASAREGLARAADAASDTVQSAGEYASQMKDRITDTASDYVDSVRDFAGETRRAVTERSARLSRQTQATLQSSMQRILREQPLAVAAVGLAAGAAVAALFPSTEVEDRVLGDAHEKLKDAAGKAGEKVMEAAGKAGERLKSAAEERGLTSEGLKEVAGEVAGTFKDAMSGKSEEKSEGRSGASQAGGSASGSSGQSFGVEQNRQSSLGSQTTQPYPAGRSTR